MRSAVAQLLEELARVVDRLVDADPAMFADPDALLKLDRLQARLDAVAARGAAAFDEAGEWRDSGARNAGHWLAFSTHLPIAKAHRRMRVGAALAELPVVEAAWLEGRISECHAAAIARLRPVNPEGMVRDEETIVEWAENESFNGFLRGLKYWTYENDPDFADGSEQRLRARREHYCSKRPNGLLDGRYTLASIGGEIFENELGRLEDELFRADWDEANRRRAAGEADAMPSRTDAQRRADALVEMAIRSRSTPADALRPAPLFSIFVGWESFHGMLCRLERGSAISPGELAPWLEEAWVERVVFDGPSRVIDVGAQRRFFTGATRRAVQLRDQECFHEFCDMPARDSQVDHIQPWSEDGPTIQDNGRVACGKHNRDLYKRRM